MCNSLPDTKTTSETCDIQRTAFGDRREPLRGAILRSWEWYGEQWNDFE